MNSRIKTYLVLVVTQLLLLGPNALLLQGQDTLCYSQGGYYMLDMRRGEYLWTGDGYHEIRTIIWRNGKRIKELWSRVESTTIFLHEERRAKVDGKWVLHGDYINRFPDGNLKHITRYRKGLKEGRYSSCLPGGRKSVQGRYRKGVPVGTWVVWDKHGNLFYKGPYEDCPVKW